MAECPAAVSRSEHLQPRLRREDGIHHFWSSELWWVEHDEGQGPRHVDFMWPVWMVFDRTPEGRATWEPRLEY